MNPNRKGQAGNPVSIGMQSAKYTPFVNTHFNLPYGLRLQQKVGMSTITNVVDAGATVVYTANNNYSDGDIVSIYGVDPIAYNLQNATILSATSTTFTITSPATGTYVSGGVAQKTGEIPVTIPSGITFVYAIAVGGGGGGSAAGGGAGGIAWGWTLANSTCIIGRGGASIAGGYTRYENLIVGGGAIPSTSPGVLGSGGAGGQTAINPQAGGTNYWGMVSGRGGNNSAAGTPVAGQPGSGGGGGGYSFTAGISGGNGGNGISGGGGGFAQVTPTSGIEIGGNGGNGLAGGGGGRATNSSGSRTGGNGGNGLNILTNVITTGGTGSTGTGTNGAGGGGAGIAGNGSNGSGTVGGTGGLGGGGGGGGSGAGGAGLLYLFY